MKVRTEKPFAPRWASPPSHTIRTALHERGISVETFVARLGMDKARAASILDSTQPLTLESARALSQVLGGSVAFWMTRDGEYWDDLARLEADQWAQELPISQMASFGWLTQPRDWRERIAVALRFFQVPDLDTWKKTHLTLLEHARFRRSARTASNPGAVAAWLQRAAIEASTGSYGRWDPLAFRNCLPEIRPLTRQKDPRKFIPALQALCAESGVALVVLRPPQGCPVSGAARLLTDQLALIALTARHLADDHFWFTLLHEVAHLLLHDPSAVFVDELAPGDVGSAIDEEREANDFAGEFLLPSEIRSSLSRRPDMRAVAAVARRAGVSPGIVVGQLQNAGVLSFTSSLNHLKRRYRWQGTTLEMA